MDKIQLGPEERLRMNRQAAKGLVNILLAQGVVILIAVLLASLLADAYVVVSLLMGGLAYLLPSALVIMRMLMQLSLGKDASVGGLFLAEGIKIGGTILLLFLMAKWAGTILVWPAALLGLVLVMKSYFLLLLFKKV